MIDISLDYFFLDNIDDDSHLFKLRFIGGESGRYFIDAYGLNLLFPNLLFYKRAFIYTVCLLISKVLYNKLNL